MPANLIPSGFHTDLNLILLSLPETTYTQSCNIWGHSFGNFYAVGFSAENIRINLLWKHINQTQYFYFYIYIYIYTYSQKTKIEDTLK